MLRPFVNKPTLTNKSSLILLNVVKIQSPLPKCFSLVETKMNSLFSIHSKRFLRKLAVFGLESLILLGNPTVPSWAGTVYINYYPSCERSKLEMEL